MIMRGVWLLALVACGEAETIELDLLRVPPPKPGQIDAGVTTPSDAGTGNSARADVFPTTIEFGWVPRGGRSDRDLQLVNRTDENVAIRVTMQPEAFFVLTPTDFDMEPNSRTSMTLRFAPSESGTHDRELEIHACADGCAVRVRLVGIAE
jgi:hypothetical protein